jgi:signal transduction histidine kinase
VHRLGLLAGDGLGMTRQRSIGYASETALIGRLGWLIRLRWLAVVGFAVYIEVARRLLPVPFALGPLFGALVALALCNAVYHHLLLLWFLQDSGHWGRGRVGVFTRFLLPREIRRAEAEQVVARATVFAAVQIIIDLVLLTVVLHVSGGIENPFQYFFIFHVIIASLLLSRRATFATATLGFFLVGAMSAGEFLGIIPHIGFGGAWSEGAYKVSALVGGQLSVLGITLYLAAYLGSTVAIHLRKHEREVMVLTDNLAREAEELEVALGRTRELEESKSRYMRRVAHELRGRLGMIHTALGAVARGFAGRLPPAAQDLVDRSAVRAGELAEMTSDLLALSRAREMEPVSLAALVDLRAVVNEVVDELSSQARESAVTVDVQEAPEPAIVRGDPEGLGQLVRNLVANAVRYTLRGGRVVIRVTSGSGEVCFEVSDTGIGIPEDALSHIWDEFYRAKNAREHARDGTGLGMAIVKAVAERHGGLVTLASEVGKGTIAKVVFPAAARAPDA